MSIRALGRQFASQWRNRDKNYWGGTEGHPQGALFLPSLLPGAAQAARHRPSGQTVEWARKKGAGEPIPEAPWREPHWSDKLAPKKPGARTHTQGTLFDDE